MGVDTKLCCMSKLKQQNQWLFYWPVIIVVIIIINGCMLHNEVIPDDTGPKEKGNSAEVSEAGLRQEAPNLEIDDFSEQAESFHIGVLQFAEHPALDAVYSGIIEALDTAGLKSGQHTHIDYYNSRGDPNRCRLTIEKFVEDRVDLIVAIATPSAQAAVEQKDIPVLFAAVTEPREAGLVETWENPNTNATGVSDLTPVEALLDMTMEVVPDAQDIGVVYNATEVNSVVQVELSRQVADELGINIVTASAESPEEVGEMAEKLADKVDVIWVPTDNTVLSAFHELTEIMDRHNMPVVGASTEFAMEGAMYATGYDYHALGLQAGDMAVELISGVDPAVMPVQMPTEIHIAINMQSAEKIGYRIPFEVLVIADQIFFK